MSYFHRRNNFGFGNGGYGFNNGNGGLNYNGGYSPLLESDPNLSSYSGETSATSTTDEAEGASEPADPEDNFFHLYPSNNRKYGSFGLSGGRKSNPSSSSSHRLSGSSSSISSVATTVANPEMSCSSSNPTPFPSSVNYPSTFSSRSSPSFPLVNKRSRPPSPPSHPILMNSTNNCNLRRPRKLVRFNGSFQSQSQNVKRGMGVEESEEDEKIDVKVGTTYSGEIYDRTPIEPTDPSTSLCLPKRESEKCCWIKCLERGKEKENNSSSKSSNKKFFKQAIERMEGKSINKVRRIQIRPTPSPMSMEGGASSNSSASEEEEGIFSAPMVSGSEESAIGSLELDLGLEKRIEKMVNGHNDSHGFIKGIDRRLAAEEEDLRNEDFDEEKERNLINQFEDEIEEDAIGLDMDGITDADGDLDGEDGGEEEEEEDDAKSVTTSATNVEETEEESFCGSSFSGRFGISGRRESKQNSMTSLSSEGGFPATMTNTMGKVGGRPKSFSISSSSVFSEEEDETPRGLKLVSLSPAPPTSPSHYDFPITPNSTPIYTKLGLRSSPRESPNASVESLGEKVEKLLKKESEKRNSFSGSDKEKKKGRFGMCGMGKWTRDEVYKSCDAFGGF